MFIMIKAWRVWLKMGGALSPRPMVRRGSSRGFPSGASSSHVSREASPSAAIAPGENQEAAGGRNQDQRVMR